MNIRAYVHRAGSKNIAEDVLLFDLEQVPRKGDYLCDDTQTYLVDAVVWNRQTAVQDVLMTELHLSEARLPYG